MPESYRKHHDGFIRKYLQTGQAKIIGIGREVVGLHKKRVTFPIDLAVSEMRIHDEILFTGIVRDITDRKQAEEALVYISERERKSIGQELHDALGRELTGLTLLAKTLEQKLDQRNLQEAELAVKVTRLAQKTLTKAKQLTRGLYPMELEQRGLRAALQELVAHTEPFCQVDYMEQEHEERALGLTTQLHLYRIAQEAINNAIKHGQAQRINIVYTNDKNNIVLRVEDNGSGIPSPASPRPWNGTVDYELSG